MVDRQHKVNFLQQIDLFSVPTTYREPKGLFALEAMACGVPVVLPDHGAFSELIHDTQGGLLCEPNDPIDLADKLEGLVNDRAKRQQLGKLGRHNVLNNRSQHIMAAATKVIFESYL